jgi:metallophosphoesterase superfamily enzyme
MLLPKFTAPKYADVMLDLEPKLQGILFYGDPHSNWKPLLNSVNEMRPKSVFIFGDLIDKTQGPKALEDTRQVLLELLNKQIDVHIVLGNHDADTDAIFNLVFEEFGSLICHGTVLELEEQG